MKKHGGFGALEHHHSSLYYLPESESKSRFKQMIFDVSAHEFLHVLTPLNLHSTHIADFNYRNPVMSEHLWLYEGVTEYFSLLVQLQNNLITEKHFFKEMRSKIVSSNEFAPFSMTEMSKNVLDKEMKDLYETVYTKGAVLAFLLDLEIIRLTDGEKTLKDVLLELSTQYGPKKPFLDKEIINDIIQKTHPNLQFFFDKYIIGKTEPDYDKILEKISWNYKKELEKEIFYFGNLGLKFKDHKYYFFNVTTNAFGVLSGDELVEIDNIAVSDENISALYEEYFSGRETEESITLKIIRNGATMSLTGKPMKGKKTTKNFLYPDAEIIETKLRNTWLGIKN